MSNPILDRAAEAIASVRTRDDLAALAPVEQVLIDKALEAAPELDRAAIGAAWIILGDSLAQLAAAGTEMDLASAVNLAQLAGQRLYTGEGLPREVRCPQVYASGVRCKRVVKGVHDTSIDAQMQGHYATYHPGAAWPPEPDDAAVISDSAHPGWSSGLEELQPRCACGAPATLAVGYRGEPEAVLQCVPCAVADPRHYFGHRDMADATGRIVYVRPAEEAQPVVHLPALDEHGNPTGHALCDNGVRPVLPGTLSYGGPGFGKSEANCATCLKIDEDEA